MANHYDTGYKKLFSTLSLSNSSLKALHPQALPS